ncbi:MAG TPA: 50S ribosomal protein L29 [Clostridiales bacterium]|nr:50S ribosomal protein L29 [Clostridiales bacterium]
MKAKKYVEMSTVELDKELTKLKSQLFNLRFQHAAGQLTNNAALKNCRRDIARVNTILRRRELLGKAAK